MLALIRSAQKNNLAARAYFGFSQQTMQIVHTRNWLLIQRNNDVPFAQTSQFCWTTRRHESHNNATFLRKIIETHHAPMQRNRLRLDSDISTANAAVTKQPCGNEFCCVNADSEA